MSLSASMMSANARFMKVFLLMCVVMAALEAGTPAAAMPGSDDDRYIEKEYVSTSPGAHELATWLIAQLRQPRNQPIINAAPMGAMNGCRYQAVNKRNSELINSLLGLPKQVSNGRK